MTNDSDDSRIPQDEIPGLRERIDILSLAQVRHAYRLGAMLSQRDMAARLGIRVKRLCDYGKGDTCRKTGRPASLVCDAGPSGSGSS